MELHENKTFFLDLDRTLWIWDEMKPGAADLIETLRTTDRKVRFVTDNTLLTREGYVEKLGEMGFKTSEDEILTSGHVAARELSRKGVQKAYVAGESGLVNEIQEQGIEITEDADYAILGFDRNFNYSKMKKIMDISREDGEVMMCSTERVFRRAEDSYPHQKSLNSAVKEFSETKLVGKPSDTYRRHFKKYFSYFPGESAFIGDRLADIETGNSLGMTTAIVMGGATSEQELRRADDSQLPDYALTSLNKLRRRII